MAHFVAPSFAFVQRARPGPAGCSADGLSLTPDSITCVLLSAVFAAGSWVWGLGNSPVEIPIDS